jgi:hypothetical protein
MEFRQQVLIAHAMVRHTTVRLEACSMVLQFGRSLLSPLKSTKAWSTLSLDSRESLDSQEPSCTFEITGWEEETYEEIDGSAKLTLAKVTQTYAGAITGSSSVRYLMSYTSFGTATFVGIERVTGTIEEKSGTFVLQHVGEFVDGSARSSWTVIGGSGTGALKNLRGSGRYAAGENGAAQVFFTYNFEADA